MINGNPGVINVISQLSAFEEEIALILVLGILYWWIDKKMGKSVGLTVLSALAGKFPKLASKN